MDLDEFKLKCPVIMEAIDGYDSYKSALIVQGKFFENHTFIFKLLSAREERILRLRCGMETGNVVTRDNVGKEVNISGERVRQIEANAFRKLKTPKSVKLLMTYTDDTFKPEIYENFGDCFTSLLIEDIVKGLNTECLTVVYDLDIHKLPLELRSCKSATQRLYKGGIKTCGELIDYMKTHSDFKKFGLGAGFRQAATIAICGLIKDGYIQISSEEIRNDYLEHVAFANPLVSTRPKYLINTHLNNVKNIKIEDLDFSTRTFNCLKRVQPKIKTLGDLVEYYKEHGSFRNSIKNFGVTCEEEVMAKFKELNVIHAPQDDLKDSFYRPKDF